MHRHKADRVDCTGADFYSALPTTSRLFARNLFNWDSAMSARSSASSSSCCTFRALAKLTLVCSSWSVTENNIRKVHMKQTFHTVFMYFDSPPPHTDAYRLSISAAFCWPNPEVLPRSSSPPHPKTFKMSLSHLILHIQETQLYNSINLLPDKWAL